MAVAGSGVLACSRARSTCNRGSATSTHPNAACAISSRPQIGTSAAWLRRGSCTPLAAPPPREQIRRRCRLAVQPRAGLYSLPPDLYGSLQTGCGLAFLLGLCFSALPILTGDSLERNVRRYQSPDTDESAENIRWSVMGVLSVLPFINPMAWVFAALDDEEAYLLYYSLAFIYALPYVANGFELDGFALLSLLICTLHVQLERIAQTEPVEVELPSVLRRLVGGIPKAVRSLGRYSSRLGTELGGRTRSAEEARKRRPDRKYLEERSRETRAELESFDKRRRERSQQQERLWQEQAQQQQQQLEQQEQEKQQPASHQQQKRQKGLRENEQER